MECELFSRWAQVVQEGPIALLLGGREVYSSRGTPNIGTAPASVRASTSPSETTACPRVTRQERPCRPASPRLPCAKHSFAAFEAKVGSASE